MKNEIFGIENKLTYPLFWKCHLQKKYRKSYIQVSISIPIDYKSHTQKIRNQYVITRSSPVKQNSTNVDLEKNGSQKEIYTKKIDLFLYFQGTYLPYHSVSDTSFGMCILLLSKN